jgi:AAA15 family ATPase/GTPase
MKLKYFRIKNIKSIIDSGTCYISDDNITIFAGQNESGKSAILESLNYFSKGIDEKFNQYSTRILDKSTPCVECCFALCDETDCNYKDENINTVLKAMQEIQCIREGEEDIKFSTSTNEKLQEIIYQLYKKHKITNIKENESEVISENNSDSMLIVEDFAKSIEVTVLGYIPTFDYYDSFEDKLPEKISIENIPRDNAVRDFQLVFDIDFAEYIKKPPREKEFNKQDVEEKLKINFNECWTQKLTDNDNDNYNFIINDESNKIIFLIDRGDKNPLYLTQKSKGFQWFLSFYLRLKALKTKKDRRDIEDYILLIDEPGQGLHEKAQEDVKKVLEELAGNGIQILYTTHNPRLIEVGNKITRLRLVYQDKVEGTKVNTLSQMASKGTQQSQDALSPIITAMGLINMSCIDLRHNKNVIVEGITDKYYLEAFTKLLNINFDYNIIPATGHENIKNIVSILLGWGCAFKVIIDGGESSRPREAKTEKIIREKLIAYDEEIANRTIKRLTSCAIEDCFSINDFTSYVKPYDIEQEYISNSALAKQYGKKELWARLFIEKVNTNQLTASNFEQRTLDNFKEIINWIQSV